MSSDPLVNLNFSSCNVDPAWISQLQNAVPGAFFPYREIEADSQPTSFPVVHIPDLNEVQRSSTQVTSELSEKPGDWMDHASGKSDEDRNTKSAALDFDQVAIENLVSHILDRFPLASPTALMFAGAENNIQVDESCAQVAKRLSERNIGKILLIDSELEENTLTEASGTTDLPGLRNILSDSSKWKDAVIDECKTPMHFLPVGNKSLLFWDKANQSKRRVVSEMKQDYQFICISVGDSHSDAASFWADVCDGAFLIVTISKTSQTLARSAVDQLRCNGARVLGCIVADSHTS